MTTSIGLIVMVTLLAASGVIFLRGAKPRKLDRWQRLVFLAIIWGAILFLVWMAMMVFVVGPSMRSI